MPRHLQATPYKMGLILTSMEQLNVGSYTTSRESFEPFQNTGVDDLQTLFLDEATTEVLWLIANAELGTKPVSETKDSALWDIE